MSSSSITHEQSLHRVDSTRRANNARDFCDLAMRAITFVMKYAAPHKDARRHRRSDPDGSPDAIARVTVSNNQCARCVLNGQ